MSKEIAVDNLVTYILCNGGVRSITLPFYCNGELYTMDDSGIQLTDQFIAILCEELYENGVLAYLHKSGSMYYLHTNPVY
jgi:hypothetical protein